MICHRILIEESWFIDSRTLNTKGLAFSKSEQQKVKVEKSLASQVEEQNLLPAGWKSFKPWPLVLHFVPTAWGQRAWKCLAQTKPSMGLEGGWFRNSCQVAGSCKEAQKVPTKYEIYPGIPGLKPDEPAQLLMKVMSLSVL